MKDKEIKMKLLVNDSKFVSNGSNDNNVNRDKSVIEVTQIPIWNKLLLTIKEASTYSNIGRDTLYKLVRNPDCSFALRNGRAFLIKRKEFEDYISNVNKISA